jgi:hypothetical protein
MMTVDLLTSHKELYVFFFLINIYRDRKHLNKINNIIKFEIFFVLPIILFIITGIIIDHYIRNKSRINE